MAAAASDKSGADDAFGEKNAGSKAAGVKARLTPALILIGGCVAGLLSVVLAITFGPANLSFTQVWRIILQQVGSGAMHAAETLHLGFIAEIIRPHDAAASQLQISLVWNLRLPRVLLAAVCGAGLSVCGVIMQSLLRNPLAEPYLLGVSSGASTGAVLVLIVGVGSTIGLSGGAFLGALVAFILMMTLARLAGGSIDKIVLAGVAITQGFSALTSFIIMIGADANTTRGVLYWLMGSLANSTWRDVAVAVIALIVLIVFALGMAGSLDAFTFGENQAASLGVSVQRTRILLLVLTALMTAILVASSGAIGFVGLVLPHVARLLVGMRHRVVIPVAAILGAIFLLWADTIARAAFAPLEVPVGVITALVGVPVFSVILVRKRAR